MSDSNEIAAVLSRTVLEISSDRVKLHQGQESPSGILPEIGGHQNRDITIGSSSIVHGSVVGNDINIDAAANIKLSNGIMAPGTEIQGSVNSLSSINVGKGVWIQGGIIAQGDVNIASADQNSESPSHILIEGGVAGTNVFIGDNVVILGPVVATNICNIGKNVTIRDHVMAPTIKVGDGCLVGGIVANKSLVIGEYVTISSSQIAVPLSSEVIEVSMTVRSPYPNCNNCPEETLFNGDFEIARKLACHLFAERGGNSIEKGKCESWSQMPIISEHGKIILNGYSIISNIPNDAVNTTMYGHDTTIWERGGEA